MALETVNSKLPTYSNTSGRRLHPFLPIAVLCSALLSCLNFQLASAMDYRVPQIAQDANDADEAEVSPAQVEKYVAVYKAMQRDRSLTVEAAAAENGMTLESFRALESRVQRDDVALQRARQQLQASAKQPQPTGSP